MDQPCFSPKGSQSRERSDRYAPTVEFVDPSSGMLKFTAMFAGKKHELLINVELC